MIIVVLLALCAGRAAAEPELCAAAGKRRDAAMCAPAPSRCVRPGSVFWLYIRQCAGFSVGKGILDSLYPAAAIAWGDGYSLAHAKTAGQLAAARRAGGVTLTALRHPVDRVVAQYFQTADLEAQGVDKTWDGHRLQELGPWVATHSRPAPRRGNDGKAQLSTALGIHHRA